jgi:cytochrome b6-f complex iron-sulfur subunit
MSEKKSKSSLSRRNFLGIAWVGSLTLIFAQAVVVMLKFIKPVASEGFGGLVFAGKLEEFAVDSVSRISSGRFFISRTPEGIIALWQKCPHLGCAIPWDEEKGVFHCPCHGSTFNQYGEVLGGPAPRSMDFFPVEVNEEGVWVDTSTPMDRLNHDPSHLYEI